MVRTFSVGVLQVLRRRPHGVEAEEPARLTDAELAAISAGIRESLRDQDILGHLGGGRFAAILPDVGIDDARSRGGGGGPPLPDSCRTRGGTTWSASQHVSSGRRPSSAIRRPSSS